MVALSDGDKILLVTHDNGRVEILLPKEHSENLENFEHLERLLQANLDSARAAK